MPSSTAGAASSPQDPRRLERQASTDVRAIDQLRAAQKNPAGNPPAFDRTCTSGLMVQRMPAAAAQPAKTIDDARPRRKPTFEIDRSKPSPARTARPRLVIRVYRAGTRKNPSP